ncbi:MAG TPA: hypothetical protein VFO48_11035, partial [Vicinamibacterales bacterium]|nr:hypothetical protein [Vicinamibacterales bacterium]
MTAIVRANGDALVLHAGERPYVVTPSGQSELASRALTLDAVKGMLNELLPETARQSLDEIGAVQHDLGTPAFAPGQSFNVVAARGGDDIWIEIRRHRQAPKVEPPVEMAPPPAPEPVPGPAPVVEPIAAPEPMVAATPQPIAEPEPELEPEPEPEQIVELKLDAEPEPRTWNLELETASNQHGPVIEQIHDVEQETYDIGTASEDVHEISLDMIVDRPSSIVDRPEPIAEAPAPVAEMSPPIVEAPAP